MINAAMFFALGVLTAGLLVLLVGPAVWRRAVRLTRRAVEATTPMTLTEVRAARDQLRAEYAVATRRLELARTALSEKVARQQLEITEGRETAKSLSLELNEKLKAMAEAEDRERGLREELRHKGEELTRVAARLRETERDLKDRSKQFAELSAKLARKAGGAQDAHAVAGDSPELLQLETEIASHKARQSADAARILALESELSQLRRKYAMLEEARAGMTAAPISGAGRSSADAEVKKLEAMIIDLEGQNVEAQAEITRLSLQIEAMRGAHGDNMEGALVSLEAENTALAEELNRTAVERGRLESQLKKLADAGDRENHALRDQITALAAQVAALTAATEGEGSVIDRILAEDAKAGGRNGAEGAVLGAAAHSRRTTSIAASSATLNRPSAGPSLADRIRDLRKDKPAADGKSSATPLHPR